MKFRQTPWRRDPRSDNFSHDLFYGTINPLQFPKTLGRALRTPENQHNTLRCAEYASAVNAGYARGFRFSPDRQVPIVSKIQGSSVDNGGSDPNSVMKAGRDFGYLLYEKATLSLEKDGIEQTGFSISWPAEELTPQDDRDISFLKVDGTLDTFDCIRSALFSSYDSNTKLGAGVQAFGKWYGEWTHAYIVPTDYNQFAGYHSYLFVDFTEVNGIPYLIAQNSYGTDAGNGGYHLFPREVINREFPKQGLLPTGTTLKIPRPISAEQIALAKQETVYGRIQRMILQIYYSLSELYGQITFRNIE